MDEQWMRRALSLAALGRGRTSPNPMVGAVLVRDGRAVGEGWHRGPGHPHAEAEALAQAGEEARGAILYVTLEPCNHHGRTPPCAPAVAAAGVRRVVAAARDPNPHVAGGGLAALAAAGLGVECGLLEREARALNRDFFTWAERGRPFVTLKYAMTLDGKAATRTGASRWITGPAARARVHQERARHDAVLAGVGTVLADDPLLTARAGLDHRPPWRVILDSRARTPPDARVLHAGPGGVLVAVTAAAPAPRRAALEAAGGEVLVVPARDGRVDLSAVLQALAQRGCLSVFVEGGPAVHAAFLADGLADRLLTFVAPIVAGGRDAPGPMGPASAKEGGGRGRILAPERLARRRSDSPTDRRGINPSPGLACERLGDDWLIETVIERTPGGTIP